MWTESRERQKDRGKTGPLLKAAACPLPHAAVVRGEHQGETGVGSGSFKQKAVRSCEPTQADSSKEPALPLARGVLARPARNPPLQPARVKIDRGRGSGRGGGGGYRHVNEVAMFTLPGPQPGGGASGTIKGDSCLLVTNLRMATVMPGHLYLRPLKFLLFFHVPLFAVHF